MDWAAAGRSSDWLPEVGASGSSPEQEELSRKWEEYAHLREQLVDRELQLQTLESSLYAFEQNHLWRCGSRYTAFDAVEAEIAEILAARRPDDEELQRKAHEKRAAASATASDFQKREEAGPIRTIKPTEELKALYRRVARMVHPDLASTDAERQLRHDFMIEVNASYGRGDLDRIREIAVEWEAGTVQASGEAVADQLIRLMRVIANIRKRIDRLDRKIQELLSSELAALQRDVSAALEEGRDLIAELIESLDAQIAKAHGRLRELESDE